MSLSETLRWHFMKSLCLISETVVPLERTFRISGSRWLGLYCTLPEASDVGGN